MYATFFPCGADNDDMDSTEAMFDTLNSYYEDKNRKIKAENERILALKSVKIEKEHVSLLVKHWELTRLDATRILKEHDGNLNKAMLHMAMM